MGNGLAVDFQSDLTLSNTGSSQIIIANNSTGNKVGGDLYVTNSASGTDGDIRINMSYTSTLDVTGNVIILQNGSSDGSDVIFG